MQLPDKTVDRTLNCTEAHFDDVLDYWFGDLQETGMPGESNPQLRRWNGKDPQVDSEIRLRFSQLHEKLARDVEHGWVPHDLGRRLATVIVLDQFPRNMYRGTARMYETDPLALGLSRASLRDTSVADLDLFKVMFLFMPLMHSELPADQAAMIDRFFALQAAAASRKLNSKPFFDMAIQFATRHFEIIDRFGRFPHRNDILGRVTTPAEEAFLKEENSSF